MVQQKYRHREIQAILQITSGFISKWTKAYLEQGVEGLKLRHRGRESYLLPEQKQAVLSWLKQKNYWNLQELQTHIESEYGLVFRSLQSYYELFSLAGISWKKTQKHNPKKDPCLVEKKKQEIKTWLEVHRAEIETGELVVLFVDECHLLWGDVTGYVWGITKVIENWAWEVELEK